MVYLNPVGDENEIITFGRILGKRKLAKVRSSKLGLVLSNTQFHEVESRAVKHFRR